MSAYAMKPDYGDPLLADDVLAHLDAQLGSAQRLLQIVLAQGVAIRPQDVDGVVRQVAAFQAELERRARLEEDRARLLARAAAALGTSPGRPSRSTQLTALMAPHDAAARARAQRRAAGPARRADARARLQPGADAPGAGVPRPPAATRRPGRPGDAGATRPAGPSARSRATPPLSEPPRPRPPGLRPDQCDLHLLRPPDLAPRPARAAAGASTSPATTSRTRTPSATRARRRCCRRRARYIVPANSVNTGAGAQLGSGVDVARDPPHPRQLPRPPVPRAEHAARRRERTQRPRSTRSSWRFAEPTDDGIAALLTSFWNAWSDVAQRARERPARAPRSSTNGADADGRVPVRSTTS